MKTKFKKACLAVAVGAGLMLGAAGGADAIVGGAESASGARPYQVSLQSEGEHYCGGTVIDATTIVTAAHCVEGETASGTTIRAGVTDVTSGAGQDVAVVSITAHPSYAQNELADIAIIKLVEPLQLGGNVQAIPLATAAQVEAAKTGTVSGWGAVSEQGDGSTNLLEANVPLVTDSACNVQLGTDAQSEVCAGGTGTDTCYGDSGGPLVVSTSNGLALAGVTSWGEECGGATPGVYADVPGLTTWINAASSGTPAPVLDDAAPADAGNTADEDLSDEDFAEDFADEGYNYDVDEDLVDEDLDGATEGTWLFLDHDGNLWAEDEVGDFFAIEDFFDAADYDDSDYDDTDWDAADYDDSDYDDTDWDAADFDAADYDDSDWDAAEWDDSDWDAADWDAAEWDDSDWDDSGY